MALKVSSRRIDVVGKEVVESIGSGQQKLDIWMVWDTFRHGLWRAALCEYEVADVGDNLRLGHQCVLERSRCLSHQSVLRLQCSLVHCHLLSLRRSSCVFCSCPV